MKRAFVLSLALLASAFVYGQRTLTLDECRSLAIQNNKELQIAGEKVRVAGYDKQAALTKYFPQVSAGRQITPPPSFSTEGLKNLDN